jgi:putative CocE/NonD family hydrolase
MKKSLHTAGEKTIRFDDTVELVFEIGSRATMTVLNLRDRVDLVETAWIPMPDGRRLAARLFLPKNAAGSVPAILEYIPYRRRDGTRLGDEEMHVWFAAHGYAAARVDVAGMGDSEGLVEDEYVRREQDDALHIIEWLGTQSWSSGDVGMIGISWGGFNGLQVAARRPPRLKVIVTMCSTDDRYACDAHYLGGCLLNDNFGWGGAFFNYAALPPDPQVVGSNRWREMWRERIDNHVVFPARWLAHQRRDEFWKHGSVCEDWSAIECPVFAVGGWLDGYTQTVLRLVENLKAPCKGLIGPWGHKEPQRGVPGPAIGFLQECARWWDQYLKGEDRGVDKDPAMRLWLQDYAVPSPHFLERPGRWLGFRSWPSAKIAGTGFHLGDRTLAERPGRDAPVLSVRSPETVGLKGQEWCPYGQGRISAEGATDQREDDGGSLCFDSAPLERALDIVGETKVHLRVAADRPQAMVAARLEDVAADGTSALVSFGVLNLSHRDGHESPVPLRAKRFYDVTVILKPVGQTVPKGHRLRLAISSSYWPMIWPMPEAVTLSIDPNGSRLEIPVLQSRSGLAPVSFEPAEYAAGGPVTVKEPASETRQVRLDVESQTTTFHAVSDDGRYVIDETGTEIASRRSKTYSITRGEPTSAMTSVACHQEYRRDDWDVRVETEVAVTSDVTHFHVTGTVRAFEKGEVFASRDFDEKIPRDCM